MEKYLRPRFMSLLILAILLVFSLLSPVQAETTFVWPVQGKVITEFMDKRYTTSGHKGIDIESPVGTPVYAAAGGEVHCARTVGNNGLTISINHADNLTTTYLHLSRISVSKGDLVTTGQTIGLTGTTGKLIPETPHLHFGVYRTDVLLVDGKYAHLDPRSFLPTGATQLENEPPSVNSLVPTSASVTPNPIPDAVPLSTTPQSAASMSATANSLAAPQLEGLGSSETVLHHQEVTKEEIAQQTAGSTVLSVNASSSPVSEGSSHPIAKSMATEIGAALTEVSASPLPKPEFAHQTSGNVQPGSSKIIDGNGDSETEANTNPWQMVLLSIAFFLTLFFILKKRISSFVSSRSLLTPAFLRNTY